MKKYISRIIALTLAVVMMFSLSACSAERDGGFIDFLVNGWDGVYEEKEREEIVWPDPSVRTHEIREDHRVSSVNNVVDLNGSSANNYAIAATDGLD